MEFYGKTKQKSKFIGVFGVIIAIFAFYQGFTHISNGGISYMLCGALILLLCFYYSKPVITKEGADDIAVYFGIKKHYLWRWEDIDFMFADYSKLAPNVMLLVRTKGKNRKYTMDRECIPQIIDWAYEANPKMRIEYYGVDSKEFADTALGKNIPKRPAPEKMIFKKKDRKITKWY